YYFPLKPPPRIFEEIYISLAQKNRCHMKTLRMKSLRMKILGMKSFRWSLTVLSLFYSVICFSCTSTIYKEIYPTLADGKYDSEFPYKKCSQQLEEISECIKMLNCVAHYKTYVFDNNVKLTKLDLKKPGLDLSSAKSGFFESTAAGTATIIYNDYNRIALLTCAHVVLFEDTIFAFRNDIDGNPSAFLQSIAVKEKQHNYVADLTNENEFDILQVNSNQDIAILGSEVKHELAVNIKKFEYPFGKAKELEWGSFVYVFGYPMGYKTLTKGLVSSPNKDKSGSFILDAIFNRGSSGGIILAVKDGVPNFELVGMIKSIPTESEYVIKPYSTKENEVYSPFIPYSGELLVEKKSNIRYGVSKAVPVESIKAFINDNFELFKSLGYNFSKLLAKESQ
ncbi:MAG: serine protease, partial [Bacteroidota bacterium]|nr:serine protease [Bacteroidota bacterium]